MAIKPTTVGNIISRQKLFLKFYVGKRNVQIGGSWRDRRDIGEGRNEKRRQIPNTSKSNNSDPGKGLQDPG